jgi:hypothetical protein
LKTSISSFPSYPLWLSLPFDFLVKVLARTNFFESSLRFFPWAYVSDTATHRALRLACLTSYYAELWNRCAAELTALPWSSDDSRLTKESAHAGDHLARWNSQVPLRSDFARRLALVEIDVLVAQALGLTLDQLVEMYRTQFHVLQENEAGTWYDANGRIVWTCSKGLTGVGYRKPDSKKPSEREWRERFANLEAGRTLESELDIDFLVPALRKQRRSYQAPFILCDREHDYARAWAFFEAHNKKKAD